MVINRLGICISPCSPLFPNLQPDPVLKDLQFANSIRQKDILLPSKVSQIHSEKWLVD